MTADPCLTCRRPLHRSHTPKPPGHVHHAAAGVCKSCYNADRYRRQHPAADNRAETRRARLEDLAWMADTGEDAHGAAARLGISTDALWRWCDNNDALDLYRRLAARNTPQGADA